MKAPIDNFIAEDYPKGNITQWFAENPTLYGRICYDYCLAGHNGIDIVAPWGTDILCVEDGIVADVQNKTTGYGKYIRIVTESGREWTYGHASENLVTAGQIVKAGDVVQKMGNTGFVVSGATPYWKYNPYAGTHLHLGMRKVKLMSGWTVAMGVPNFGTVLDYSNGFFGSLDYREELEDSSPKTVEYKMQQQLTIISLINQIIALYKSRQ